MDQSKAKKRKASENASEYLPPPPQLPRKKKKAEDQRLEKAFVLLTACSNQTIERRVSTFWEYDGRKIKEL